MLSILGGAFSGGWESRFKNERLYVIGGTTEILSSQIRGLYTPFCWVLILSNSFFHFSYRVKENCLLSCVFGCVRGIEPWTYCPKLSLERLPTKPFHHCFDLYDCCKRAQSIYSFAVATIINSFWENGFVARRFRNEFLKNSKTWPLSS